MSRLRSAARAIRAAAETDATRLERFPITERDTPTKDEVGLFEHRKIELERWLAPAGQGVAGPVLSLLTAMPSQSGAGVDQAMRLETFIEDLGDLPYFAVERACKDFRLGIAGAKHWAPTAAEIRERAHEHARQYRAELADIETVLELAANPPRLVGATQSERADIVVQFRYFSVAIGGKDAETREQQRQKAQAALDTMDPSMPVPKPSAEALAICRLKQAAE